MTSISSAAPKETLGRPRFDHIAPTACALYRTSPERRIPHFVQTSQAASQAIDAQAAAAITRSAAPPSPLIPPCANGAKAPVRRRRQWRARSSVGPKNDGSRSKTPVAATKITRKDMHLPRNAIRLRAKDMAADHSADEISMLNADQDLLDAAMKFIPLGMKTPSLSVLER
jgi:hypothetical protein